MGLTAAHDKCCCWGVKPGGKQLGELFPCASIVVVSWQGVVVDAGELPLAMVVFMLWGEEADDEDKGVCGRH